MRVLYINHVSQMSGAEHSLLELLKAIPRDEVEPVVALPGEGLFEEKLKAIGIETVHAPLVRLKKSLKPKFLATAVLGVYRSAQQLARLVKEREISCIHSNSTSAHFVGGRVAKTTGKPAIWHVRDVASIPVGGKMLGRSATRIVAISHAVRDSLIRQGLPDDRMRVVHNGVDLCRFNPEADGSHIRQEHRVPTDGFVFGMLAQMVPWKRHDLFLSAAGEISTRYPQTRFWVVGDDLFGDHPDYVAALHRQVCSRGLANQVSFFGYRSEIPNIIAGMAAVVVPSDCEPFGRVVIEAMAMGKPVIATRAGGPMEIIEDGKDGILISPGAVGELSAAMDELVSEPQLGSRLGAAAREHVVGKFDIQRTAKAICEIYHELVRSEV